MLHVAFLRSQHAHARLTSVDASAARGRPGVVAIYTAADLGDYWRPGPLLVPPPPIKDIVFNQRTQVPLAKDKVRHAGEPVALVIAESRHLAEDAAAEVVADYEPLPPVVDLEEVLIPWAAMRLDRPVKWIEDRREHFLATTHERSQIHDAELAVAVDGTILGVKDVFLHDTGAYDPYGLTVPINSQCTLLGPYLVPHYDSTFTAVFTNKPTVTPYRGAGRQHGVFVIERLLDIAARNLGIDRAEIRRRNFIPAAAFPYNNEIIYQDFAPLEYDSGNYAPVLDKALAAIGYDHF